MYFLYSKTIFYLRAAKVSRGDSVSTIDDIDIDYDHTEESIDDDGDISTLRNGRT